MNAPPFRRCHCRSGAATMIAAPDRYEIESGHTAFALLRCMTCGGVSGMPNDNLSLALEHGTADTHERLRTLTTTSLH